MKDKKSIGFFLTALTLIFIFCKLTGRITWSWFWVLSPILIPTIIFCLFWLIVTIYISRKLLISFARLLYGDERIQDREDMQDKVNRKVVDEMFNGEN